MSKEIIFENARQVAFQDLPDPPLTARQVRVRTLYSGISAGTEMTAYRGSNVYLFKHWDAKNRLFISAETPSSPYPLGGFGYEEVGEVIEIGEQVTCLKQGDIVFGTWGHRTQHILEEEYASQRIKPAELEPILGIFSHIGPIALNGILDAQIHIGENVAVFGLGVIGQIVAQLAKRSGARVFGVDPIETRLALAAQLGSIDVGLDPRQGSPAERIKALTDGLGADVSIEVSGSMPALHEAIRATSYSSRVVALGFYQGEANNLFLGEEFHHNRINLVCSQISNVDPSLHFRWDRIRMIRTIMDFQVSGILNLRPLITHVIPFDEAAEAFRLIDTSPEQVLEVVLDFSKV